MVDTRLEVDHASAASFRFAAQRRRQHSHLRKGGGGFSNKEWEIEGRFAAAENLPGNPALHLTEAVDSPLYRVGAGLELNGVNGVGTSVRYNGAFGQTVKQNAVSASLKVSF
ncbi:hypothetical protein [Mesorhizobium erdmanii]|uniref:hypothetical protein n=1 Tax=Mesorhizobium erdmanii TaxID=1777866 RepID=UPI0012B5EABD|nr:hypothetical protein [Mesorhizobium erdmanii]